MDANWQYEHSQLYDENGQPRETLRKLQEETAPPQRDTLFPVVRVSNYAHAHIMGLRNEAHYLGSTPLDEPDRIEEAYARVNASVRVLATYIEQLEYQLGISRATQLRF